MPDPVKVLQAKRAALLAKAEANLAKAEKASEEAHEEAAAIEADMADLARLKAIADKYGMRVVEDEEEDEVEVDATDIDFTADTLPAPNPLQNASMYVRAKLEGEALIRSAGKPLPLGVLYDLLTHRGVVLGGKTPKNTLSAYLGQNPNLRSTPHGWWIANQPLPDSLSSLLTSARVLLKDSA